MIADILDLRRPIGRAAYLAAAAGLFFSQHVAALGLAKAAGRHVALTPLFWLAPFRVVAGLPAPNQGSAISYVWAPSLAPDAVAVVYMLLMLAVAAAIAALSFRRAITAGHDLALPALTVVPVLQLPAAVWLALGPSRPTASPPGGMAPTGGGPWAAIQGVLAGMGLTVVAVALSALVFRSYGYGLFVGSPFLIGITTGYLANRRGAVAPGGTLKIVTAAAALGGVALLVFALEGAICILLAAPLGWAMAAIGGLIGREFAVAGHRRSKPMAMSVAAMPLIFAIDVLLPPLVTIDTRQSVDIAAPPVAVWRALTSDAPIAGRPAWPIRIGLSYPLRSQIVVPGVGGERLGYFSTGVARERITDWSTGRRLAFTVIDDPPVMRELSPYAHVHAPHVKGYFHTVATSFEIVPTASGGARVVEQTQHELRLDPALYWTPMARLAIDRNNARVLASLKQAAEREASGAAPVAPAPPPPSSRAPFARLH